MPKITIDELKKIRQKLCPHNYVKHKVFFDWECLDCNKSFLITEVVSMANRRLKIVEGNYKIIGVN